METRRRKSAGCQNCLGTEPLLVGDVILLEVLLGVRSETDAKRVEAALRRFDVVPMLDPDLARDRRDELSAPASIGNHRA